MPAAIPYGLEHWPFNVSKKPFESSLEIMPALYINSSDRSKKALMPPAFGAVFGASRTFERPAKKRPRRKMTAGRRVFTRNWRINLKLPVKRLIRAGVFCFNLT
jgi:hypothetical protein